MEPSPSLPGKKTIDAMEVASKPTTARKVALFVAHTRFFAVNIVGRLSKRLKKRRGVVQIDPSTFDNITTSNNSPHFQQDPTHGPSLTDSYHTITLDTSPIVPLPNVSTTTGPSAVYTSDTPVVPSPDHPMKEVVVKPNSSAGGNDLQHQLPTAEELRQRLNDTMERLQGRKLTTNERDILALLQIQQQILQETSTMEQNQQWSLETLQTIVEQNQEDFRKTLERDLQEEQQQFKADLQKEQQQFQEALEATLLKKQKDMQDDFLLQVLKVDLQKEQQQFQDALEATLLKKQKDMQDDFLLQVARIGGSRSLLPQDFTPRPHISSFLQYHFQLPS
ncbi:MAG: hypothetical protein J3R72DRAFT_478022 [Linnemannia gamsii]|nr:MAG: hypothetical protein J3R72DRAFT_478022 [Linnemannia gamsii]